MIWLLGRAVRIGRVASWRLHLVDGWLDAWADRQAERRERLQQAQRSIVRAWPVVARQQARMTVSLLRLAAACWRVYQDAWTGRTREG